ncbi:DNA methyltransferase [Nitrosomonas sp.]|uniref:DNA methyltransferase n=1 Tax=Nitrosomonas sp. TaxID=42353 RepID=UPI001DAC0D01|nr:site-specific DNA-methyltransferase [Nitrosomonas sp.]
MDDFITPKPEGLIQRVLEIATNPGDLVLDSFAGSGTTGSVAHKMGRRWIMVELGEHCHTHIIPRLKKVIDGDDQGGISKAVNWQGGGGFRYYRLAPTLIVNDRWGNPVINPEYNAAQLAEALAKLEGFTYAPSEVRGGSTAIPASAISSTSPRKTSPPISCRRCPTKSAANKACWCAAPRSGVWVQMARRKPPSAGRI